MENARIEISKKLHEKITFLLKTKGFTKAKLANATGQNYSSLNDKLKRLSKGGNIELDSIVAIAVALEVETASLFTFSDNDFKLG